MSIERIRFSAESRPSGRKLSINSDGKFLIILFIFLGHCGFLIILLLLAISIDNIGLEILTYHNKYYCFCQAQNYHMSDKQTTVKSSKIQMEEFLDRQKSIESAINNLAHQIKVSHKENEDKSHFDENKFKNEHKVSIIFEEKEFQELLDEQNAKIIALSQKNQELRLSLETTSRNYTLLKKQKVRMDKVLDEKQKQLKMQAGNKIGLNKINEELKKLVSLKQEEIKGLQKKNQDLECQKKYLEEQKNKKTKMICELVELVRNRNENEEKTKKYSQSYFEQSLIQNVKSLVQKLEKMEDCVDGYKYLLQKFDFSTLDCSKYPQKLIEIEQMQEKYGNIYWDISYKMMKQLTECRQEIKKLTQKTKQQETQFSQVLKRLKRGVDDYMTIHVNKNREESALNNFIYQVQQMVNKFISERLELKQKSENAIQKLKKAEFTCQEHVGRIKKLNEQKQSKDSYIKEKEQQIDGLKNYQILLQQNLQKLEGRKSELKKEIEKLNQENIETMKKIQGLKLSLNNERKKGEGYEKQIKGYKKSVNDLQDQLSEKKTEIQRYQSKVSQYQSKLKTIMIQRQTQNNNNRNRIEEQECQIKKKNQQINLYKAQIQKVDQKLKQAQKKIVESQKQCSNLQVSLSTAQKSIDEKKKKIQQQQHLRQKLQNDNKQLTKQLQTITSQKTEMMNKNQTTIEELNYRLKISNGSNQKLKQKLSEIEKTKEGLEEKIVELEKKIVDLQRIISDLRRKIDDSQVAIRNKEDEIKDIEQTHQNKTNKLIENEKTFEDCLDKALKDLDPKLCRLTVNGPHQQFQQLIKIIKYHKRSGYLSQSQLFTSLPDHQKEFIQNQILNLFKPNQKIKSSKTLMVIYPDTKQLNWNLIFNRPYLFFILKMTNGKVIAGFSMEPYAEKTEPQGRGILLSVTDQICFKKKQPKGYILKYDPYAFTFGNNEIKVYGKGEVTSSFGTLHANFDSQKKSANDLIGQQRKYQSVEIHQLIIQ